MIVVDHFNVHANDRTYRHASKFELLDTLDLQQVVVQPTHKDGNTLDLVITRSNSCPSSCLVDPPNVISDHSLIVCKFPSIPFTVRRVTHTCRPLKKMDLVAFNSVLISSPLCTSEDELCRMTAPELFDVYDATLRQIIDAHTPATTTVQTNEKLKSVI